MEDNENQKNFWQNIKSKYILSKIWDNLDEIKLLNLIKYNKAIQTIWERILMIIKVNINRTNPHN